jgi:hypothetical protein
MNLIKIMRMAGLLTAAAASINVAVGDSTAQPISVLPAVGITAISMAEDELRNSRKSAGASSLNLNFALEAGYLDLGKFGIIVPAEEIQQDCSILDLQFEIHRDDFQFEEFEKLGCSGSFHAEVP